MARGPRPLQFKFNNLFNKHFSYLVFFQKYFFAKKLAKWRSIVIEKWYNRWLYLLTSNLLLEPDLHSVGPLVLRKFSQHLPAEYR